jgi:hypothetical protein
MIIIENTVITDDIKDQFFVCNIEKCKGACCVEGDLGAPLEKEELGVLEDIYEKVKPYLSDKGEKAIAKQGVYVMDFEGDYSTPVTNTKECAYAVYDKKGILKCAIEQAYLDGEINYKKPVSCHLYPLRITKYDQYDAINYHRWGICADACTLGSQLQVPLYKFLKEPLIRKYGQDWYKQLLLEVEGE